MNYTDNYPLIRNRYKKYLTRSQSKKILDLSKSYSRQNAFNRVAAASALRTGFQQGFNGLRNTGMQNSGEVERLKRKLGDQFTYTNDQLKKNELGALNEMGAAFKRATIRARNRRDRAALPEKRTREKLTRSGQRGIAGGAGRNFMMNR